MSQHEETTQIDNWKIMIQQLLSMLEKDTVLIKVCAIINAIQK
ncbi:hypothetical protein [Flavobacterium sp. W22_SRS_FP1]